MVELSHIGEGLICTLLNKNVAMQAILKEISGVDIEFSIAIPELRLNPCADLIFDGVHKVDISILDLKSMRCFPIEAKLGLDRLSKNEFTKRFTQTCTTSHSGRRIAGSMISILDRKLPSQCVGEPLSVTYQDQEFTLSKEWGLISRQRVQANWHQHGYPTLTKYCKHLCFEELVSTCCSKTEFNELVGQLLTIDYYECWVNDKK